MCIRDRDRGLFQAKSAFPPATDRAMTRPGRYLVRMLVFLVAVAAGLAIIRGELEKFFFANAFLNGLIMGILVIGILYCLRQVLVLWPEVSWIEHYKRDRTSSGRGPRLLAPMARMLGEREGRRLRLTTGTCLLYTSPSPRDS